jgi:hypothetical protein
VSQTVCRMLAGSKIEVARPVHLTTSRPPSAAAIQAACVSTFPALRRQHHRFSTASFMICLYTRRNYRIVSFVMSKFLSSASGHCMSMQNMAL